MANPQLENGFTQVAHDLVEAFTRYSPGYSQAQVLFAILRQTFGWHKKVDSISISQLSTMTSLSPRQVMRALQNLEIKGIIKRVKYFVPADEGCGSMSPPLEWRLIRVEKIFLHL